MPGYKKYRVWWIPRIAYYCPLYIDVENPEEGKLAMRVMRKYDQYIFHPLTTLYTNPHPSCGLKVSTKDGVWESLPTVPRREKAEKVENGLLRTK